ncbi:MAG: restriction endonuclease subunit S [bacterium]
MKDAVITKKNDWTTVILKEVADVNVETINKDYQFGEIEYVDVASVEDRKITSTQKLKLEDAPSRAKRIVKDNSILISTVRPNLKHYCFVKKAKPNLIASTGFAVVNAKDGKADPFFLYNLLTTKEYTDYLIKIADSQTSTYPAFNPSTIQNSIFLLPSVNEQQEISLVLESLDNKIELLRKQNETLEAMAQALFKQWFVRFNFPGATGKMIDSELGEIPEGWRVGKLGEVVAIQGGTTPSTKDRDYWDGDIAWTSPKDLSNNNQIFLLKTEKTITKEGLKKIGSGLLPKGTLLLSSRAPIGYLAITNIELAINQGYIAFLPNQIFSNQFMFLWLKSNMDTVISSANGSTFLEISKSSFRNIDSLIPDENVLKTFNEALKPIFLKMLSNTMQIQTVATIRDAILPKLMKGELRVV